jgi:hypothetical protein
MKMGVVIAVGAVILVCAGAIAAVALSRTIVAGKRKAPPTIKPVIIGSVEYRVPNTIETEGIVEAWNTNPQKLLWKRKIYPTLKFPSLLKETDVQLNFITNMITGPATNELTVVNEKGGQYILNTASQKVTRK